MSNMSPLLYLVIGLIGGGSIVAVVVLLTRRGNQGAATEMAKRLETIDHSLRDEFSRNREEAGAAAKNQREELARSLESVRSIVDVRLRQLQDDNATQIDKMRTAGQFAKNMKMRDDTDERVEFAIKLPGDENGAPVWLPIDAKFPMEHYDRLAAAQEKGDPAAVETTIKTLETQLKRCAKDICEKYINPP